MHGVHKPLPPSKFFILVRSYLSLRTDRFLGAGHRVGPISPWKWRIKSSTSYTTRGTRSRIVAPFSNRGSRTRKHLFVCVAFDFPRKLQSWKAMFPGPSISPVHYARSLFTKFLQVVAPADLAEGGLTPTVSRVVGLTIADISGIFVYESLFTLHRPSPVVRSLRLTSTTLVPSHFPARFVNSNLAITDWRPTSFKFLKPSAFIGTLELPFMVEINGCYHSASRAGHPRW